MQTSDNSRTLYTPGSREGRKATFRAAGTSLNGQSQAGDILVEVKRYWQGCTVERGGAQLRAKAGTVLGHANAALARHGRQMLDRSASDDIEQGSTLA